MHRLVLAAVILAVTATAADARRRHHRFIVYRHAPVMLLAPGAAEAMRYGRARIESPAQLVPRDWQLMPADPNWHGRRYMAPDGNAWLAFYATNAANDAQARFKAVAFAEGEDVTYLRGERDRLAVAGRKGDRLFYRKVTLACGGTIWRHVAMEYPAAKRIDFEGFIERVARGFDQIAANACGDNLFASPQPATAPVQPKADDKPAPN